MMYDVVIVGAGISGLATAVFLAGRGVTSVLLVEYQREVGGFAAHTGGQESFQRERKLIEQAGSLDYEKWTEATAVGLFPGEAGESHQLFIQTRDGTKSVEAKQVVIATGAMEKPREAHRIAGTRPAGVMTPMLAVQLLKRGYLPGRRIVAIQSGRLSAAAASLCADASMEVKTFAAEEWEVLAVQGVSRLTGVELRHRAAGTLLPLACDTLLFASGRIPCGFFLKGTSILRDAAGFIQTDDAGRTNVPGVYAAGSCTSKGDDEHLRSSELARRMAHELVHSL